MTQPDRLRRKLLKALAAAGLALGIPAHASGSRPLAAGIRELMGQVTLNGRTAKLGDPIRSGDLIATGPAGHVVLVIGQDAYLLRENTRIEFRHIEFHHGDSTPMMRVLAGKILSVMAKAGPRQVHTPSANLGIRGTGFYIEVDAEKTYLCTCYGVVELGPANHSARETVATEHHEAPRYIYDRAEQAIVAAPMINHRDSELIMLEGLVGRRPPFPSGDYRY